MKLHLYVPSTKQRGLAKRLLEWEGNSLIIPADQREVEIDVKASGQITVTDILPQGYRSGSVTIDVELGEDTRSMFWEKPVPAILTNESVLPRKTIETGSEKLKEINQLGQKPEQKITIEERVADIMKLATKPTSEKAKVSMGVDAEVVKAKVEKNDD